MAAWWQRVDSAGTVWLERTGFVKQFGSYGSAGFLCAPASHAVIALRHGLQKTKGVPRFKRGTPGL